MDPVDPDPQLRFPVFSIKYPQVQETGIKTIPMEKKYKKAKWPSGEALQIGEKRREAKGKGEKETYSFEFRVPKNSKEREESLPQ